MKHYLVINGTVTENDENYPEEVEIFVDCTRDEDPSWDEIHPNQIYLSEMSARGWDFVNFCIHRTIENAMHFSLVFSKEAV